MILTLEEVLYGPRDRALKYLLDWKFCNAHVYTTRISVDPPKTDPKTGKPKTKPKLYKRGQWRRVDWRTGQIMPTRYGVVDVDCPLEDFNESIPK
jgi:hypothetical protein